MVAKKSASWDETVEHPLIARIEKWGRKIIYGLASLFLQPKPAKRYEIPKDFSIRKAKKILLIKVPYRMGDLLQITPLIRALKANLPDLYLGLVVRERNYQLFKDNPYLDEIFIFEKNLFSRPPWRAIQFFRKIRSRKFDLAVTLETERAHLSNDLTAFFSGVPIRMRYDGNSLGSPESNIFYNFLVPLDFSFVHEVDKNFGVFKSFGLEISDRSLFLKVSNNDLNSARKILASELATPDSQFLPGFIVILPGAYKINNRWPLENFISVAQRLKEKGKNVIFILGPAEKEMEPELRNSGFPVLPHISLLEMAGILKMSELVFCNDTGNMHIAAAVGAKTVALFGQSDPARWKPPGEKVRVIQSFDKKIFSITVETVSDGLMER